MKAAEYVKAGEIACASVSLTAESAGPTFIFSKDTWIPA